MIMKLKKNKIYVFVMLGWLISLSAFNQQLHAQSITIGTYTFPD